MNIVHVGAHQDDEARALGTLIKYRREGGHNITFICTTNGDKGFTFDTETPYEVVAAVREREMRAVAGALGAGYICLGEPDEYLYDSKAVRLKLIDALRACKADLIFTDWIDEYNADHTITAQLVLQCAMLTMIASIKTEHPALAVTPKIFHCDPGAGSASGFEGTHFVELSEAIVDEKVRVINLHESQMAIMRHFGGDWAEEHRRSLPRGRRPRRCGVRRGLPPLPGLAAHAPGQHAASRRPLKMLTPRARIRAALHGEWADRVPFSVYWLMFPRGDAERRLRNEGVAVVERVPVFRVEMPNVQVITREYYREGMRMMAETVRSPVGEVHAVKALDPSYGTSWFTKEFYFKEPDDYRVLEFMVRDTRYVPNDEAFRLAEERLGEDGFVIGNTGYIAHEQAAHRVAGDRTFQLGVAPATRLSARTL